MIHHVFLPPKLPQTEDDSSEITILNIVKDALTDFRARRMADPPCTATDETGQAIDNAITLLSNLKRVHSGFNGGVNEVELLSTLTKLQDGQTMAIKVTAQNAAVVITRKQADLVFEQFELSPQNKDIMGTKGRLVREFPALAVTIDVSRLQDADFAATIANTLSTMSYQTAPGMQPVTRKAGKEHFEGRDSTRPDVVSELLFGFLRAIGSTRSTSTVRKNTREEVMWQNTERPWRRSPMWLLIRVALQLTTSRSTEGSSLLYKQMMAFIMSYILEAAQRFSLPAELFYVMNAKIDRRCQKLLGIEALQGSIGTSIRRNQRRSNEKISARWGKVQKDDTRKPNMGKLKDLKFEEDTHVCLPDLDTFIQSIRTGENFNSSASFIPSTGLLKHDINTLPPLPSSSTSAYAVANLQQFEQWVEQHLDRWITLPGLSDPCDKLCSLIKNYHPLASQLYANNPEVLRL